MGSLGASLRVARESNKVKRASSGLWGNCGMFDDGAQCLEGQKNIVPLIKNKVPYIQNMSLCINNKELYIKLGFE